MSLFTITRKSSVVLPCDPSLPYEILTDYDSYAEWLPSLSHSKLLAKEGDLAIAEFGVGRSGKDKYAVECIHTRNRMVLTRTISGVIPVAQYEWKIEPDVEGCRVTLVLSGKANWRLWLPVYRRLTNPGRCLEALKSQVAAFSPDISIRDEKGEKILELMETEQGLVCWLRGKKYAMTPVSEGKND
jgi:ribosome-associated toxin RatA of RatAB toxin-antitoxin module